MKLRTILLASVASLVTGVLVSQAQVPGVNSTLNSVFTLAYDNSTMKQTYSANGSVTIANAGSATTDVCAIYGSATKNIRVRRIIVSGTMTAIETLPVSIVKRSTASLGNGTQPAEIPYDASNAANTGYVETWAANPGTLGTLIGTLADIFVTFPGTTTSVGNGATTFTFGQLGQPLVLRTASQNVAVNFGNNVINTGLVNCTV